MKTRKPAVAGKFYPNNKKEINNLLKNVYNIERKNIDYSLSKKNIIGGIVPHAGYIYSSYQAIHFFEIIKHSQQKFDTVIIINPNHMGIGQDVALDENDYWESPLGNVEVDKEFSSHLSFKSDENAHKFEHSGEVMLPMLQYFINYEFKILPISMNIQNCEYAKNIALEIYNANKKLNKSILLIASSDFTHFETPEKGRSFDDMALEAIISKSGKGVYETVKKNNLSICGYGPIISIIEFSKLTNPDYKTQILKRGHSGEIIASKEVVDYISMLFYL